MAEAVEGLSIDHDATCEEPPKLILVHLNSRTLYMLTPLNSGTLYMLTPLNSHEYLMHVYALE